MRYRYSRLFAMLYICRYSGSFPGIKYSDASGRWLPRRVALDKSRLRNIASEASGELRKGKYAIDYLNAPARIVWLSPFFAPISKPLSACRVAPRFAGNACLAFPGIVTTPSASEYCQPPRLNCITYYCLLFGVRFARYAPSHPPSLPRARIFPPFHFLVFLLVDSSSFSSCFSHTLLLV